MRVPFNRPSLTGKELFYIAEAVIQSHLSGDGKYTRLCHAWLEQTLPCRKALLTHSCTAALEMAAILCDIQPGDQVIMPSYTFVSTANAFVLRGAEIVFVDLRPDTLNLDENLIESAITPGTRAIVPVHYAGVGCEMNTILEIAREHGIPVVEDAAQAMMSRYDKQALGTIGDLGAFSFHETKNYNCGEGGVLIVNNESLIERAEIIREKGTNRPQFFRGEIDKYSWQDLGSSFLPSELNAAYLYAQLEHADEINRDRLRCWNRYYENLFELDQRGCVQIPKIPALCQPNGHIFYLLTKNVRERNDLLAHLNARGVGAIFHYVPLHSSPAGKRFGRVHGSMDVTGHVADCLIRLPVHYRLADEDIDCVIEAVHDYYRS